MALGTVNVPPKTKHTHTSADISDFTEKVNTLAAEQVGKTEPKSHSHAYSDITGKPSAFPPESHSHAYSDITDKPSSFTPAAHNQAASTITAGTLAGAVVAADDTAYTTYKVRNSALLSAKPSSIVNGRLAHVYS